MYACIYTYKHCLLIHNYIHELMISLYISLYIYIYILLSLSLYICMYACIYEYIYIYIHTNETREGPAPAGAGTLEAAILITIMIIYDCSLASFLVPIISYVLPYLPSNDDIDNNIIIIITILIIIVIIIIVIIIITLYMYTHDCYCHCCYY